MKKLILIYILISIFSTGSYFIHKCHLYSYKKNFKLYAALHKKTLITSSICINPSELFENSPSLIWLDENTEVIYKGVLYDVLDIKNNGICVLLNVIADIQEAEIEHQYALLFQNTSDGNTKEPFELLKDYFELEYINSNFEFNCLIPTSQTENTENNFQLTSVLLLIDSPPPDLSFS